MKQIPYKYSEKEMKDLSDKCSESLNNIIIYLSHIGDEAACTALVALNDVFNYIEATKGYKVQE